MIYINKASMLYFLSVGDQEEIIMVLPYTGQKYYELEISGFCRRLPIVRISEDTWIASFVMLGDVTLVNFCAGALATKLAKLAFDYIVCPEAKVLPLAHALSTFLGRPYYIVCRKSVKAYMTNPLAVEVQSITTSEKQSLVMDSIDVEKVRGKKVVVVDDVVSTGGTMDALEELMKQAGATVIAYAAVLKEGDLCKKDFIYLEDLPVFKKQI